MAVTQKVGAGTRRNINLIPDLVKQVAEHETQLKEKHKVMFGNGNKEIGWDEQLRQIWAWIEVQKGKEERRKIWWDKFQWVIIPILVVGFFSFMAQVVYFYFVIVPQITLK